MDCNLASRLWPSADPDVLEDEHAPLHHEHLHAHDEHHQHPRQGWEGPEPHPPPSSPWPHASSSSIRHRHAPSALAGALGIGEHEDHEQPRKNRVVRASRQRKSERVQQARGTVMATNALPRYSGPETDRDLPYNARIARAIGYVAEHYQEQPSLEQMAEAAHLSPFHFQRVFKRWAGVSPKRFLQYVTLAHAKRLLVDDASVLDAALEAGLSGPSRLHDLFITCEAMTPGEFKALGSRLVIRWGLHDAPLGRVLLGVTERGICWLSFVTEGDAAATDAIPARVARRDAGA